MYKFVLKVTNRKSIATISALLYISAPYKMSNIFDRNAVGEYTAFVFIPMVFEGIYNILYSNKKSFLLCIGIIGLVLSHTISTIYTAIFAIIFLLINIDKLGKWNVWKRFITNAIVALLVCMFYIVPLLEHCFASEYVIYDKTAMKTNTYNVYEASASFKDLFASEFGEQGIRFSLGIMTCILTLLGIICYKKINKNHKRIYLQFFFLACISLIMSTKLFPWFIIPQFLGVIQFAWRNIGFFAFFISLVCGINAVTFAENVLKGEVLKDTCIFAVIISIFVFASLGVMRNWKFENIENEKIFDETVKNTDKKYLYSINRDYMPLNGLKNQEYILEREDRTYILKGKANIVSENKVKLKDYIYVENVSDDTILELPYLYYLGYDVTVSYNGKDYIKINTFESSNGFVAIKINDCDNAKIKVEYKGTIAEKVGYITSGLGTIILISVVYKNRRKNKLNDKK